MDFSLFDRCSGIRRWYAWTVPDNAAPVSQYWLG